MAGSTTRELVIASAAVGIPPQPANQLIATASAELRSALDEGLPRTHPKCEALLLLINAARLHLIPKKQRLAPRADGLSKHSEEIALDIDNAATATATSIGLRDAEILRRNASHIIKTASRRTSSRGESEKPYTIPIKKSRAGALKMRLLPRAAISSTDSIFEIIRTDVALGNAAKLRKQELANEPAERKKRFKSRRNRRSTINGDSDARNQSGLTAQDAQNFTPSSRFPARTTPVGPTRSPATVNMPDNYSPFSHMPYMGSIAGGSANVRQRLFAQQQQQQNQSYANPERVVPSIPVQNPVSMAAAQLVPAPIAQSLPTESEDPERFKANSIRMVLAERERNVLRRLSQRQAELLSLPLGVSEDVRRKAIIESKQMKLLETQRRVRSKLCIEMKKSWSPSYNEFGVVPNDHLSKLCRRHQLVYTFTDGFPRVSPYDAEPAPPPPRHPTIIARESRRMAAYDRRRMIAHDRNKKAAFAHRLAIHVQGFENYYSVAHHTRARICRAVIRFFVEKAKAEEKRKKQEQYERLRLLKSNDEQAYFNLLKSTKNERLLQLIRQTDNYLMQIGAQVEKVRDFNEPEASVEPSMFSQELKESKQVPQSIDAMKGRRNMYYTVTHSVEEEVEQPNMMIYGKLKSYQLEGLKWLVSLYNNGLNGILADEMGLGKTIQTIALLTYLIERKKNPGPYLVIVPLSTVGNWVRELDLWAPTVNKIVYRGNRDARRQCEYQMSSGNFNVVITTYEFVVRDVVLLSRFRWQYIIIDEGHRMKNAKCKLAITLGSKYRSKNRLLLTGTPLQNNLTELWALLNFLLPSIFASADTFEQWFKKPFETTTLGDTAELEEEETLLIINRLHQVLRPFLLRRLKTDVEKQLPQKLETVIRCDMSVWQRVLLRQVKEKVGLAMGANGTVRSFNNLLMQCKKICNHPYLFYEEEALMDLPSEMLIRTSGKLHMLQHLIPKLKAGSHRTLIFSQMTAALDYLEDFLAEIGIQYLRLDGGTKSDVRQEMLNDFNAPDSPYFCFLLSTRAGGLGLNLQTADTVIIFDSDWNPMMDLQAQDRAHRIGQKNEVRVFRLISSGTIEVKILDRANKKLEIDAQVIQAGQFNNKSTETDQRQMLQELLSKKTSDGDELGDVPTIEELNRIVARNEEEFEQFTKMDKEREEENPYSALISEESELPPWVLKPDKTYKTPEEREKEIVDTHGRGRRKRNKIKYVDQMSEKDFQQMVLIEEP